MDYLIILASALLPVVVVSFIGWVLIKAALAVKVAQDAAAWASVTSTGAAHKAEKALEAVELAADEVDAAVARVADLETRVREVELNTQAAMERVGAQRKVTKL